MLPRHLPRKISLSGLHTFSVCDSTSAFHWIDKRKVLNIIKGNKECCIALALLGENLHTEDHQFNMIESILCQAYGFLSKSDLNDVQCEKKEIS